METTKAQKMFALVDQWRQSGKTRLDFCAGHQVKVSTFSYWVTRKNNTDRQSADFLPIDTSGPEVGGVVQISYPNGIRVSLPAADVRVIRELIRLG